MSKVAIIGCGACGEAIASSLVIGEVASDVLLYDTNQTKATGVAMDFNHGQLFHHTRVSQAHELLDLIGSDIVVFAAGERKKVGESRRELLGRNAKMFEELVPKIARACPESILLVVTDPVDQLTQVAAKLSNFPPQRVIGAGTFLDSSRLRSELARQLRVKPHRVHAYVLGEHGDASVLPLSCALVGGIHLEEMMPIESINRAHENTKRAADDVIALRGYTSSASGAAVAKIIESIIMDTRDIIPLSTSAKGRMGIQEDVFISLPCVVGKDGATPWKLDLPEVEIKELQDCAKIVFDASKDII